MAGPSMMYIRAGQYRDCYEECSRLIDSQKIQPGQFYDWPEKYAEAWVNTDLPDAILNLLLAASLSYVANGTTGIQIRA